MPDATGDGPKLPAQWAALVLFADTLAAMVAAEKAKAKEA